MTSSSSSRAAAAGPLSLKQRIHAFKIPLSPRGLRIARVVYFTFPIVAGVWVMHRAMAYEERHRGEWVDDANAVSEEVRTQQQLNVLRHIAHDSETRLP